MDVNYRIINRGTLLFQYGEKTMIINGEVILNPSSFETTINAIKAWEAPHHLEVISEDIQKEIVNIIKELSNKEGNIPVLFN